MRGWVYVLSNRAMPGLLKIGYSLKDPDLRARELEQTGVPHPFTVEYELLTIEPREIEQGVHHILHEKRERKEWFRCDLQQAMLAIRHVANGREIIENIRNAELLALVEVESTADRMENAAEPTSEKQSGPIPPTAPPNPRLRFSAPYKSHCYHCQEPFCVTITRHDRGAYCPACNKYNDLSAFIKRELPK